MPRYLHISVTFLDPEPAFNGRGDAGDPEWPPSPMRLFQALVAAAFVRWRDDPSVELGRRALNWLARQHAPLIVAPVGLKCNPVRIAVPNNDMDVPARFWAKRQ